MSIISTEDRAKIEGLIKTTPPDRLAGMIKLMEDYAVSGGDRIPEAVIDPNKLSDTITATHSTLIKKYPRVRESLMPSDYKSVPSGYQMRISSLAIADNAHIAVVTDKGNPLTPGYIWPGHWIIPPEIKLQAKKQAHAPVVNRIAEQGVIKSKVKSSKLSQPDASTCQAACMAMALNAPNEIYTIRNHLTQGGRTAGDPWNMARIMSQRIGSRYVFDEDASINDMKGWLKNGEFLILHGWFTSSGHVVAVDGISLDVDSLGTKFDMSDPWSEFDFSAWDYNKSSTFFDGYYSARGIYAACVASWTYSQARSIYDRGEMDSNKKGAWCHRIKPEGY